MAFGGSGTTTEFRGTDTQGNEVDISVLDKPAVLFIGQDTFRLLQKSSLGVRVKGSKEFLDLADSSDPIAGFTRFADAAEHARSVPLDLQPGEYYAKVVPHYREAKMVVEMRGEIDKSTSGSDQD